MLAFCRSLNIIISSPFIFLKPLDEMSPRLVGVNSRCREAFVDVDITATSSFQLENILQENLKYYKSNTFVAIS